MGDELGHHTPVLVDELMTALEPHGDGVYVDCSFGRGGHSRALLERVGPRARVIAIDRDPLAVRAGERLAAREPRFEVVHARFSALADVLHARCLSANGIIFDLGVSSPQLDAAERGFSFRDDGPLDMRMDPGQGQPASAWLAVASAADIAKVLRDYGEERYARRIAAGIVRARARAAVETTAQLVRIIHACVPARARHAEPGQHPATRSFQAIRIHVNHELEELDAGLAQALESLRVGGRLAVISFHSLEDRRVKRFMRDRANPPRPSRHLPLAEELSRPRLRLLGKPVHASAEERARNPRARSAVLRCAEKLH